MNKKICAGFLSLAMIANMFVFAPGVRADEFDDENFDFGFEVEESLATSSEASPSTAIKEDKGLRSIVKENDFYNVIISYKTDIADEDELQERADRSQERTKAILEKGLEELKVDSYESFYIINAIHAIINDKEVLEEIANLDEVLSIENNVKISIPPSPSTPIRETRSLVQENLSFTEDGFGTFAENIVENVTWAVKNTRADRVWKDYNLRGDGITIGIMDTGVNYKLPELKHAYKGYDASTDTFDDAYYKDFTGLNKPLNSRGNWHGTMVATSIVGKRTRYDAWEQGEDGKYKYYAKDMYYYGTAPNVKFISAKVLDEQSGDISNFIGGGQWLLEQKPDIINNSWGSNNTVTNAADKIMQDMIANWQNAGIVVVFASGNEAKYDEAREGSIAYPASMRGVFAVGAINQRDRIWAKSQRGKSPYTNDIKPDVVAPGVAVKSLVYAEGTNNFRERTANGTSFAAPMTSGVIALIKEADPSLSSTQIYNILRRTARPLTDEKHPSSPNMTYGYGAVDAYTAVSLVLGKISWNEEKKAWETIENKSENEDVQNPSQEPPSNPRKDEKEESLNPIQEEPKTEEPKIEELKKEEPKKEESPKEDNKTEEPKKEDNKTDIKVPDSKGNSGIPSDDLPSSSKVEKENKQTNTNSNNITNNTNNNTNTTTIINNTTVINNIPPSTNTGSSGSGGSTGGGSSSRGSGGSTSGGSSSRGSGGSTGGGGSSRGGSGSGGRAVASGNASLSTNTSGDNVFSTNKTITNGRWEQVTGKWYLLDISNIKINNAWVNLNGTWYALDGSGVMATSWAKINNKWYYFNNSGAMLSNAWLFDKGRWYYLGSDGAMLFSSWLKTGDKWYYLDVGGAMLSSTSLGSYRFDATGALIE